ncbi:MAG TPA: energy transducer TonB [Alloacidobacterium sp.]|nr:energy transducer TonB [Alloacidobacterium sp.]
MRHSVLSALLIAGCLMLAPARAQVLQSMNYDDELRHARSLLAGNTPTDISHHIHYDVKFYDAQGHESTATYDIYRDPILYDRVDIKAPSYQSTLIRNLRDNKEWRQVTGEKPLKLVDLDQALDEPHSAIQRFASEPGLVDQMEPQELEHMPLLCANDNDGTAICFDPMIHLFAYAQMFNRTIMYDQWLPIGTHVVPGHIRIYQEKKLLVEATGTVEAIRKFPPHLMELPDTPSQPDPITLHKFLHYKPIDLSDTHYGNIQVRVWVDEQGKITKEEIIDSDDKHLNGIIHKFFRNAVMQPQMKDGIAVPFDTVINLEYYPRP